MTPEEYAKIQRDFLLSNELQTSKLYAAEFDSLKAEISAFLRSNLPDGKLSIPKLHETTLLDRILERISKEIDQKSTIFASVVENSQKRVIRNAAKTLAQYLRLDASIFEIDKPAIKKLIGRASDGSPLSKFFARLNPFVREKAKSELIMGFGLGESHTAIAKRLTETADVSKSYALTVARTETNESYRAASRDFYETANIKEYVWMSVLNANTCVICWHLHGQKFKTNRKVFSHPNCRCVLVPVTKNQKEIITGAERFKALPIGYQKQILGAKKFELYKSGGYDLRDFVGFKTSKEFGNKHFIKSFETIEINMTERAGAFGNWKRVSEKFDPTIVKQTSGISCVSAVGEMLLKERGIKVSQAEILEIIGEPADIGSLAKCLNRFDKSDDGKAWRGIVSDEESLEIILEQGSIGVFMVDDFLRDRMLHAVLVKGRDGRGLIKINDTFDQTSYKMSMKDFLRHWGGQVILRWFLEK